MGALPSDAPGCHRLRLAHGPWPRGAPQQLASGAARWGLACAHCNLGRAGTHGWLEFFRRPCGLGPIDRKWVRGAHDLVAGPGGCECRHCGLQVRSDRVEASQGARCVVWAPCGWGPGEDAAYRWMKGAHALAAVWAEAAKRGHASGRGPLADRGARPQEEGPGPVPAPSGEGGGRSFNRALGAYACHRLVKLGGFGMCVRCGSNQPRGKGRAAVQWPLVRCPGPPVPVPARVVALAQGRWRCLLGPGGRFAAEAAWMLA